jgi:predicted nucleic acid-binding protein
MTFIDTGAFLARYLPSDQHHKVATALWNKIRTTHERCVTSNFVLDETFTLLARRASYSVCGGKSADHLRLKLTGNPPPGFADGRTRCLELV